MSITSARIAAQIALPFALALAALSMPAAAQTAAPVDPQDPNVQIDSLNAVFGKHEGKRGSHAKGFCAKGDFVPEKNLSGFVQSPLFKQKKLDTILRFSVGGGNPGASDKSRSARGLAVRMAGGGDNYDLVLISEPVFFAATPASFVSFLQARVADPATKKPDPAKIAAHNAMYPDGKNQPALLAAHSAPASYVTTPYYSANAFVFHAANKSTKHARIIVEPVAGTHYLTEEEEKTLPDAFLENELKSRLASAPAEFKLVAQLPAKDDSLVDSSAPWAGTEKITLGTLRVTALAETDSCDKLVFMPVTLPAGITPSNDPILAARAPSYAVSLGRRTAK